MAKKEDRKAAKAEKKAAKAEKKANKEPMNPDVKAAVIRCVSAVLCVIIVIVSAFTGVKKINETNLAIAGGGETASGDDYTDEQTPADTGDGTQEDVTAPDGSGATADDTVKDDVVTPDDSGSSDVVDNGGSAVPATTKASGSSGSSSSSSSSSSSQSATKKAASSIPSDKASIISYYNTATKKVDDRKLNFTKNRTTTEKGFTAGALLRPFKGIVYQFMGVGPSNAFSQKITNEDKDSYYKYFKASTLKASDVTSAKCVQSGSNYVITLTLANGSSSVKDGKVISAGNTALDRCGISCGEKDKDYWDHKNAENVNAPIAGNNISKTADISENYKNAVVKATINASTGNLVSLDVTFDFHFDISKVKGQSATADAHTVVKMSAFKW